jgi:hypothetical protein
MTRLEIIGKNTPGEITFPVPADLIGFERLFKRPSGQYTP